VRGAPIRVPATRAGAPVALATAELSRDADVSPDVLQALRPAMKTVRMMKIRIP
jgi:hypothetical protein